MNGPKLPSTPAFSARATIHQTKLSVNDIIFFDEVLTNLGGCYSANSSIFTAPVGGIYYFTSSTMSKDDIQTEITVNGNFTIARMFTGTHDGDFDQGVNMGLVRLGVGDKVWVRKTSVEGDDLFGDRWTTFSGFLTTYLGNE